MKSKILIISILCCLTMSTIAISQSQSQYALLRRPVVKNPLIYKLTKSMAEYYWGAQLFINCYSGATSYVMTTSHVVLSATSYDLDHDWNRLLYSESKDNFIRAFGSRGSGNNQFLWPECVDAHSQCGIQGYTPYYFIFVLDSRNQRIAKLRYNWQTLNMEWLGTMGEGNLSHPNDMDINDGGTFLANSDDYLWVTDRCYLKRFTMDGVLQNTYGTYGHNGGVGKFCAPSAVVCGRGDDFEELFSNNNYIYVADPRNQRIVWLEKSTSGEDISWLGEISAPESINDLEADIYGHIWAVDRVNGKIYKYTYDLFPLCTFGSYGTGENQFRRPYCIFTHGGYQGCGNLAVHESWTDSSGLQYFCAGTDILDFSVENSNNDRYHYIRYVLIEPSKVTVEIHGGPQKQYVKTIREGTEWSGQSFYVWNGQKEDGSPAVAGWYSVVVFDTSLYISIHTGEPANNVVVDQFFYHALNPYTNYIPGDVNDDGNVNVGDAVYIINYIFYSGPEPQPYYCVGDVNADTFVNVGDVVYLIGYVFRGGAAPMDGCEIAP